MISSVLSTKRFRKGLTVGMEGLVEIEFATADRKALDAK
jgi:hypothetical protein